MRRQQYINQGWKFMHGDFPEAKEITYDDDAWFDTGIPHSFGIPYFQQNDFYVGYGCYRKAIKVEPEWNGKELFLEFQGVFQETEIYVNGTLVGIHIGGYTAFHISITDYVHTGENLLFVRVNNNWNPQIAPRAGEHIFNGGIYRDVSLIVVESVHVDWYGTFVSTPEINLEKAQIRVETEIINHRKQVVNGLLISKILYRGELIQQIDTEYCIDVNEKAVTIQNSEINKPHLWSPNKPELYTLVSEVYVEEELTDRVETIFGVRYYEFTAEKGFFLNGEHYDIIGANVHQDHAGWSDAVTHSGIYRDVKMIKDCGMNFIRGSHYPHHSVFAKECDKQGILFWSELCFWGIGGCKGDNNWLSSSYPVREEDEEGFKNSCRQTLREMIRVNRNHPSIIVWSMCNEVFFCDENVLDKVKMFLKELVAYSHELDNTRPAAIGGAQRGDIDSFGDVAGYNGDGATLYRNPGFPNFVSEYGSSISDRPGEFHASYTDHVEENPIWRCGKALWCGFHHGSIISNMGHMGMIDYYRLPLNSWFWYKKELLGIEPPKKSEEGIPYQLKLDATSNSIKTDGTEDVQIIVTLCNREGVRISNGGEVTLRIVEGGGYFPTGKTIKLSSDQGNFLDGMGAIEMRSYYAGVNRIVCTSAGVKSGEIQIIATGGAIWDGQQQNLQTWVPCKFLNGKEGVSINQAMNRPVFCSSFSQNHPGRNVTIKDDSYWCADTEKYGQWIMIDLEGARIIKKVSVKFAHLSENSAEILISMNGKTFERLADYEQIDELEKTITFEQKEMRYVKVWFEKLATDIIQIQIID